MTQSVVFFGCVHVPVSSGSSDRRALWLTDQSALTQSKAFAAQFGSEQAVFDALEGVQVQADYFEAAVIRLDLLKASAQVIALSPNPLRQ